MSPSADYRDRNVRATATARAVPPLIFAPAAGTTKSLDDLAADLSRINPNIKITFGTCTLGTDGYYHIPFTATNSDTLDEAELTAAIATWQENGFYRVYHGSKPLLTVGPGQTTEFDLPIPDDSIPRRLVLYKGQEAETYNLDCR